MKLKLIRPIAISLSPNTDFDDFAEALKTILDFRHLYKGPYLLKLTDCFRNYLKVKDVYFFNSGRSALYCLLKAFGVGKDDEVIIQGFTCMAVPDPIIWLGAKPVYADIDRSLNIDPRSIEQAVSKKTRAIIVQHTFGLPAQIAKIKKIAQKFNLVLIEDCAHALGTVTNGIPIGKFGDAAFFSFGRDKIISSVFGGSAILNRTGLKYKSNLEGIYKKLTDVDNKWLISQILHPLAFFFILPLYNLYLGKLLLHLLIKFRILTKPVDQVELSGRKPKGFPARFPNALARLALLQLKKLKQMNKRRLEISSIYFKYLDRLNSISLPVADRKVIYLRYNIMTCERDNLYRFFRRHNILLGRWYSNVIDPLGVDFARINYRPGSLPRCESIAKTSLNLPTYPYLTDKQVYKIVELLKKYESSRNQ